jgi:sodium/proline symporter
MMSTADSSLLAFSSMWVKDLFVPYIKPQATQKQQIWFGRAMSVVGLSIGVALGEIWSAACSLVCHACKLT